MQSKDFLQHKKKQFLKKTGNCLLTAKVFQRDMQFKFSSLDPAPFVPEPEKAKRLTKRSKIVKFSKRSEKRLKHVIRNSEDTWKVFITLTYPAEFPCDGKTTKAHLNAFLQFLRRKGIKYVWVLEFQKRGAPHYHIIASDFIPFSELSERWYKIVGSGDEKHLKAGTQIQAIRSKRHLYGYLCGYIKKLSQKTPPEGFENVGRFWGSTRGLIVFKLFQKIGDYCKLSRMTKIFRMWYKAYLRKFGIKWKWKGQGFTALDGTAFLNHLLALKC